MPPPTFPPVDRLSKYVNDGFDLVAFSGGKGLLGPQGSGLLLGRKDLIEAAQHAINPHGGIGRGMKVGKEELMGLLAAVERYLAGRSCRQAAQLGEQVSHMIGEALQDSGPDRPGSTCPKSPITSLTRSWSGKKIA